jgi:nucleotide-binding universal stress UspA family protein
VDANRNILIAVDDSEAASRAVAYVAMMIGGRRGFYVRLVHVLPPLPPELMEFGGAENPAVEEEKEAEIRDAQARWLKQAEKTAAPVFESAKAVLRRARVPMRAVTTYCCPSVPGENFVTDLLEDARTNACGTVVIGRESFTGLRRFFAHHFADELVRQGHGLTICVVE